MYDFKMMQWERWAAYFVSVFIKEGRIYNPEGSKVEELIIVGKSNAAHSSDHCSNQ